MLTYQEKLKHPKWQKKRLEILKRDNWACKKCGDVESELMVHHKFYKKGIEPWEYNNDALVTLCINCHEDKHELLDSFHINNVADKMHHLFQEKSQKPGIQTGFSDLDNLTSGLQNSQLIILAGRPGNKKTSFEINLIRNIALYSNQPVALFSLGMPENIILSRLFCLVTKVDFYKVMKSNINSDEINSLNSNASNLRKAPIFIDASPNLTLTTIIRRIKALKTKKNIRLVIIDYLQLITSNKLDFSEISRLLKLLAIEMDIPIILISQLDKKLEERTDKRPRLKDLPGSDLANNSDLIIFLYRDEAYNKEESNPKPAKPEPKGG